MKFQPDNVGSPQVATASDNNSMDLAAVATTGDPKASTKTPKPPSLTTHIRKSPRAGFHDYNGGVYFVTVCTKNKCHYFGEIRDNKMLLSSIGMELNSQLMNISRHYKDVDIPLHVVMPNHFHAIVTVVGSPLVVTDENDSHNMGRLNQLARLTVATSGDTALTSHHSCRLGNIVSAIKAGVTRFARRNNMEFGWQSRYHDHIIRGRYDGNRIAEYIENNVARWANDCYYE